MDIRAIPMEDLATFVLPGFTALGFPLIAERIEQTKTLPELDVRLNAFDGEQAVGSAGAYSFALTASPGHLVDTAGLTAVGVLPTHRRRGVLTALIRRHFEEARKRKQPLAALFASEGSIYQRFGYGMASLSAEIEIDRAHTAFQRDVKIPPARARLISEEEAGATFPAIWDRVRSRTPGMLSRSLPWWQVRRIGDPPWIRGGRAPLQRLLIEIDGQPAGYAIYRLLDSGWDSYSINTVYAEVVEAVGDGLLATTAVWRFLLDIDLVRHVKARLLPIDHPLLFLLADARRLRMRLSDALWVRLVDVEAALSARGYAAGPPIVISLLDSHCPWNEGHFLLQDGVARRTSLAASLRMSADALASIYLGAFRATQLAAAGRIEELREGALAIADALFTNPLLPWSPEIF